MKIVKYEVISKEIYCGPQGVSGVGFVEKRWKVYARIWQQVEHQVKAGRYIILKLRDGVYER